jgi:regulator of sirC expression with transglutaminase-like and TPR domain
VVSVPNPRDRFAEIARVPDARIDLAEAALIVAAEEYPGLDVGAYQERLDDLARAAGERLRAASGAPGAVALLNRFLFEDEGFAGDRDAYYDPKNSFLNDVIDRRRGIPITLSILYMEVARRVGLEIRGVGFPGHFLVEPVAGEDVFVDPFFGRVLTRAGCADLLRETTGGALTLRPELHLRVATSREILVRLLSNLKNIFVRSGELGRALACSERILLLVPDAPLELRDRGILYDELDCQAAAVDDLERFLALDPDDESAGAVRERLAALRGSRRLLH